MSDTASGGRHAVRQNDDLYFTDVRVTGFEEDRSKQGKLMHLKLRVRGNLWEEIEDGDEDADLGEEEFELRAKPVDANSVRVQRFRPLRNDEAGGIHYNEFPMFWEAVGELDSRGYTVDTGCMEYGGEP